MHFCPFCGTLLLVHKPDFFQLYCPTCTYIVDVRNPLTVHHDMTIHNKRPEAEDEFLYAHQTAEGRATTTVRCANEDDACVSTKAYFVRIQMRSADEPETIFYRCTACGYQWKSD